MSSFGLTVFSATSIATLSSDNVAGLYITEKGVLNLPTYIPNSSPATYIGNTTEPLKNYTQQLMFVSLPIGATLTYRNQLGSLSGNIGANNLVDTHAIGASVNSVKYALGVFTEDVNSFYLPIDKYGLDIYNSSGKRVFTSNIELGNILASMNLPSDISPTTIVVPPLIIDGVLADPYFSINGLGRRDEYYNSIITTMVTRQSENTFLVYVGNLTLLTSGTITDILGTVGVYVGSGENNIQFCRFNQ